MNRQRILSNLLAMGVGQAATFGFSLFVFVLISRYLGPSRFGELALAKAIVMVAWLGATLGMETLITRTVARSPERAGPLASAAMVARTALAIPVLAAVYVYVHVAHLNQETILATYAYGGAQIIWSLERVLLATFQGREHMSLSMLWSIGRNVLTLGLVLIVRWWHGGIVAFAATQIPVEIAMFLVTLRWMQRFGRLTWRVSPSGLREVTQGSLAFWANEVFFTIYLYVDTVILAGLAGTLAVGIYAPPTQMLSATMFLTVIIGPATLPWLSRLGVDRGVEFTRAGQRTLSLFIVCGVLLMVGAATFGGAVILTVLGPAYQSSVPVLVVLSLAILPMFLNFQFSQLLAASDRQWWWAAALAGACIVNPLLNFLLIPMAQHAWHNAALGAALAWLITEILEVVYGTLLLPEMVLNRVLARTFVGVLGAGAAQAATVWAIGTIWLPLGEAFGVAAYATVAVALGAIPRADVALLAETARRQLRGRKVAVRMAEIE